MIQTNGTQEYFIKCECGFEILHIEQDKYEKVVYFSLWYYSNHNLTWKNKLYWIWNIIKGKPYHDTIIVSQERINEVIEILEGMKNDKT